MEDQDFRSTKKKRCTRKPESDFPTMSEEEIAEISKVLVPSNTAKNTQWAVGVFTEWRRFELLARLWPRFEIKEENRRHLEVFIRFCAGTC